MGEKEIKMLMNVMKFDKFPLTLSPLDSKSGFVPIIIAHVVLFLAHSTLLYIYLKVEVYNLGLV